MSDTRSKKRGFPHVFTTLFTQTQTKRPKMEQMDLPIETTGQIQREVFMVESEKPAKIRRTKNRTNRDPNYRPGRRNSYGKLSNNGIFHMRCNKDTHVEDDANNQIPLRIVSMIDVSKMGPVSPRKLNQKFIKNLEQKAPPSMGKLIKVVQRNEYDSPIKVLVSSPNKESANTYILERESKFGCKSFLTNRNLPMNHAVVESLSIDNEFFNSGQYKKIKKYFGAFKEHDIFITSGLVKKTQKELKTSRNQQSIMQGSAGKCAEAMELFVSGIKWEWLHLVAHCILGKKSQHENNLVGGTKEANTNMALIENELKYLATKFPKGFTLKVKAHLMKREAFDYIGDEYLQIATHMEYEIFVGELQIPFDFNLQDTHQPHIDFVPLIHAMFEAIVDLTVKGDEEEMVMNELPQQEDSMYCYRSKR